MTSTSISGGSGSYTYNGDGLRTSRTLGGSGVTYRWDVGTALPVILQDSAANTYVYGLDLISRTDAGGAQEYHLADGLGSTTGLASGTGAVADTYTYDVFGAQHSHTGSSAQEFTFTGEQMDSTGLQYLRARYYDAATGRFVSRDPLPFVQRYAYVGNGAVNYVDPLGLCRLCIDVPGIDIPTPIPPIPCPDIVCEPIKNTIDWADDHGVDCVFKGPLCSFQEITVPFVNYLATQAACKTEYESYFDASVAIPNPLSPESLAVLGGQVSCNQGLHPYVGVGVGAPGPSFTMAPKQSINEGVACGLSLGVGQAGLGGGLDSSPYGEVGYATPGYSCIYVLPGITNLTP